MIFPADHFGLVFSVINFSTVLSNCSAVYVSRQA